MLKFNNYETTYIISRYLDLFEEMLCEQEYDDIEHIADSFKSIIIEFELPREDKSLGYFAINNCLNSVNWLHVAIYLVYHKYLKGNSL